MTRREGWIEAAREYIQLKPGQKPVYFQRMIRALIEEIDELKKEKHHDTEGVQEQL